MADRLIEEFGAPRAAADALWNLARENQWYREGEGAERYLLAETTSLAVSKNEAALELDVYWHRHPIGSLRHDGLEWTWQPVPDAGVPPLVRQPKPGRLPPFIEALLPEGWLENVLAERDERDALRTGRRYMSNVTIVPAGEPNTYALDVLVAPLAEFTRAGRFVGRYAGPTRGELDDSFEQNLARLYAVRQTPRLSGVQIKAPMSLLRDGVLVPASEGPFTHILKPAGGPGFEQLPRIEWLCLELGRAAGFEVPSAALLAMPQDMPPALLVERFDIRRSPRSKQLLALEDFCSLLDLPASSKYDATIERAGKALRGVSTAPDADMDLLLRRAIFAWLIADGDMHLKNLAVVKVARADNPHFSSVRLAPLYDSVCTRVFPKLAGDRMALKLHGKDDRLTAGDFIAAGKTLGLTSDAAERACIELAQRVETRMQKLKLPTFARADPAPLEALSRIVLKRTQELRGLSR